MSLSRPREFLSKKPSSDLDDDADLSIKIGASSSSAGDEIKAKAVVDDDDRWSRLLPELLTEIIKRVEESEDRWPSRRSVVACAGACKRWRETALEIVRPPLESCRITFPFSLKQPGPREFPMQCFIKRNKKNSTFYLYLCLTRTFVDKGKFLLAARRTRRGGHVEYIISLDADDISQKSNAYVGKLRMSTRRRKMRTPDPPAPAEHPEGVPQQQHAPAQSPATAPSTAPPTIAVDAATLTQWLQTSMQNQQQQSAVHQMFVTVLQTLLEERRAPLGSVVGTLQDFNSFNPPMFSGTEEPEVADAWLKLMQRLLRASHIPEGDMVSLIQTKMEGEAGEWIESELALRDQEMSWETFKEVFRGRFFPPSSERAMVRRFVQLEQGDSSVASYTHEFEKLSRYAKTVVPNEAARVERYIEGLKIGLRALVRACNPRTLLEAHQHALQMEQDMEKDKNEQTESQEMYASPINQGGPPVTLISAQPIAWAHPTVTRRTELAVTCFGCGKKGHVVQECRLIFGKCLVCGSSEHKIGECPDARSKKNKTSVAAQPQSSGKKIAIALAPAQTSALGKTPYIQDTEHKYRKRIRGRCRKRRQAGLAGAESTGEP